MLGNTLFHYFSIMLMLPLAVAIAHRLILKVTRFCEINLLIYS